VPSDRDHIYQQSDGLLTLELTAMKADELEMLEAGDAGGNGRPGSPLSERARICFALFRLSHSKLQVQNLIGLQ